MALTIRRKSDGSLASKKWYADFEAGGKRYVIPLDVFIKGEVPANLRLQGDRIFEQSRGEAKREHDKAVAESRTQMGEQRLVERLIEIKTSGNVKSIPLEDLPDAWASIPRKRQPSSGYELKGRMVLSRFIAYLQKHHTRVKDLADISSAYVREFMDAEQARGISPRTWNYIMSLLRGAFRHLEPMSDACRKYLSATPAKIEHTIHREPFKPNEISAILESTANNVLMRPLIITALCTAMRRGDCATLKWDSVDLKAGFITVKTSKTGETVEIPIMPLLRDELINARKKAKENAVFVFPAAEAMYRKNPYGLDYRLRRILFTSGFVNEKTAEKIKKGALPVLPPDEVRARGLDAIKALPMSKAKRERMTLIFKKYTNGQTIPAIAGELQISKGTAFGLLKELQEKMGVAIIRRRGPELPATIRGLIHAKGEGPRLKRGSLRGWHSFRTTFITLALSAGLPMELVRRVTGHTTVDVVLKHYFRPGREDFRRAMQAAMPKMLTKGAHSPQEEVTEILNRIEPLIDKSDAARLRELMQKL